MTLKLVALKNRVKNAILQRIGGIYQFYFENMTESHVAWILFTIFTLVLLGYITSYSYYFFKYSGSTYPKLMDDNMRLLIFLFASVIFMYSWFDLVLCSDYNFYLRLRLQTKAFIRTYHEIVELVAFAFIFGHMFRTTVELFIRADAPYFKNMWAGGIWPLLALIFLCCLTIFFSNDVRNISVFRTCFAYLLCNHLMDKLRVNPLCLSWFNFYLEEVLAIFRDHVHPFASFLIGASECGAMVCILIHCVIFSFIVSATDLLFLPHLLGTEYQKKRMIASRSWVFIVQLSAIFVSPFLALFLSLPSIHLLSDNEVHAVLASILSAPNITFDIHIVSLATKLELARIILSTLPALRGASEILAPVSAEDEKMISVSCQQDRTQIILIEGRLVGVRAVLFFGGKIISCVIMAHMAFPLLVTYFFSYLEASAGYIFTSSESISLENVAVFLLIPFMELIHIPRDYVLYVSFHIFFSYFMHYPVCSFSANNNYEKLITIIWGVFQEFGYAEPSE